MAPHRAIVSRLLFLTPLLVATACVASTSDESPDVSEDKIVPRVYPRGCERAMAKLGMVDAVAERCMATTRDEGIRDYADWTAAAAIYAQQSLLSQLPTELTPTATACTEHLERICPLIDSITTQSHWGYAEPRCTRESMGSVLDAMHNVNAIADERAGECAWYNR